MAEAEEIYVKTPWEKKVYNLAFPSSVTSISSVSSYYVLPATTPALTVVTPVNSGGTLQFVISDGKDESSYRVHALIVDQSGRQLEGCGQLKVREDPS